MKIGLDVHGVCDLYSDLFRSMSFNLMMNGHEIHIITGQEWEKVEPKIKDLKISYSHHFSIVDYHLANGTKTWKDAKGTFWMDEKIWVRTDILPRLKSWGSWLSNFKIANAILKLGFQLRGISAPLISISVY